MSSEWEKGIVAILLKKTCLLMSLILFLCLSCRERGDSQSSHERPVAEGKESTAEGRRTIVLSPQDTNKGKDTEQTVKRTLIPFRSEPFLAADQRVVMSDTVIGPLADSLSQDPEKRAVYECIASFSEDFSKHTPLREDLLHPEWREMLVRSLTFYKERNMVPADVRIGEITIDNGEAEAPIRLIAANRIPGRIFLEKFDSSWYITDVQGDFGSLATEYVRPGERFEPSLYRWLEEQ